MRKYPVIIFLNFILAASSCKVNDNSQTTKVAATVHPPVQINTEDIKGRWFLNKWTGFNVLIFADKTVFVDNHVDTVFTLNYAISHDSLITWLGETGQKFKNKIVSLNKDSMELDGINEVKERRTYYRKKKGYN